MSGLPIPEKLQAQTRPNAAYPGRRVTDFRLCEIYRRITFGFINEYFCELISAVSKGFAFFFLVRRKSVDFF